MSRVKKQGGSEFRRNGRPKGYVNNDMRSRKAKKERAKATSSKRKIVDSVLAVMQSEPEKEWNERQLAAACDMKGSRRAVLVSALQDLEMTETVINLGRGHYKLNLRNGYVEGVIDRQANGKTYLQPDDGGEPIFIAERRLRHAMDKDRVRVFLYATPIGHEPEGEVVEVLQRSRDSFVGVIQVSSSYGFLRVDNKILTNDIFIPAENLHGAKDGQKVIVKIVEWRERDRNPVGEVIDVLGDTGDNNAEMHAILAEFGLPYRYPEQLEREADRIPSDLTREEIEKRRDMRSELTFTIDPRDAKDFDDALSIVPYVPEGSSLPASNSEPLYKIGVHIADVTHYVKPQTGIDQEAQKRATSVYLVDRTIPMLPEHLSNELCSLRPDEDKLTFSVVFIMDKEAQVKDYEICRTVIRSDRRFTYEEAQAVIEAGGKGLPEGLVVTQEMADAILTLDGLAKKLRERRFQAGAISFESTETRFEIDEKGTPLSVYFKESKDANKLIEEFMLLANRTVATHIGHPGRGKKAKPFVYRVHDVPNPDKLENFSKFIKNFGYKLKTTGKATDISKNINTLLEQVQGRAEQNLVQTIAVRSMAKAVYTTQNIGHYGLAFDYYTHFTSPIRRYPDMMVHRLLERYLNDGKAVEVAPLEDLCDHCSSMEQLAANAERASIKYKEVEYMSQRIGKIYDGVISGVTEWGIYVCLNENKCEGMIPIRDLGDDYYVFDEKNYCLVGKRTHRRYTLGDLVTVRVKKTNLEKKQMDFQLIATHS